MKLAYMSVPDAYGVVEAGVFRSKAPDLHNLPFLMHSVLYLSPNTLTKTVTYFLDNNKIKLASWKTISQALIKDAIEINILHFNNHPILVMCSLDTSVKLLFVSYKKYMDQDHQGQPLLIKSAIALDHLKGYLYIESEKEAYVRQGFENTC